MLQSTITLDELVRRLVVNIVCFMHLGRDTELLPIFRDITFSSHVILHGLSGLLALFASILKRLIEGELFFVRDLIEVAFIWSPQIGSASPLSHDLGSGLHHLEVS